MRIGKSCGAVMEETMTFYLNAVETLEVAPAEAVPAEEVPVP